MHIKTFIFVDFETTGLFESRHTVPNEVKYSDDYHMLSDELKAALDNSYGAPKMTEFAFIAVSYNEFVRRMERMEEKFQQFDDNSSIYTRVHYRAHSRIVDPLFTNSEWDDYQYNRYNKPEIFVHSPETLENSNTFEQEWNQLRRFLRDLPKPACFVAHNGISFDYRVLDSTLQNLGADHNSRFRMPQGIYFVDSLLAFQKIENDGRNGYANTNSPALYRRSAANYRRNPSFKQPVLYNDIVKDNRARFHEAHEDAKALIQICLAYGADFLEYASSAAARLPF